MTIDWTKPLELMDGTPVVLTLDDDTGETDIYSNPDPDGDYWITREDGDRIVSLSNHKIMVDYAVMCVHANGCEEGTGKQIVRNRTTLEPKSVFPDEIAKWVKAIHPETPTKTLRDEFAMAALTGLCSSQIDGNYAEYGEMAYRHADAMMAARK